MPMYMDIHDVPGVRPEDVAKAHLKDLAVQGKHGVEYVKYWVNPKQGKSRSRPGNAHRAVHRHRRVDQHDAALRR